MSNIPPPLDNSLSKPLEDLSIGLNSRKDSNNNTLPFFAYIITIDNNNNLISMAIDDTTQLVDIPTTHPTLIPPNDSTSIESLIKTHISDKLKTLYTQSNDSIVSQYSPVVPRFTAQIPSPPAQLPPRRFNAPRSLPVNTTAESDTTLNSNSNSESDLGLNNLYGNEDTSNSNSESDLGLNNLYGNEDTSNSNSNISSLSQSKIGGSSKSIKKRRQRKKDRKTKRRTKK
jgi:hypothetical protein